MNFVRKIKHITKKYEHWQPKKAIDNRHNIAWKTFKFYGLPYQKKWSPKLMNEIDGATVYIHMY